MNVGAGSIIASNRSPDHEDNPESGMGHEGSDVSPGEGPDSPL